MDVYENYLRDLGDFVRQQAIEARDWARATPPSAGQEYERGRQMTYGEVVSLMQQQAVAFQIPLEKLRLDGIDPEKDLLP
jgi:hypothetical protein